MIEVSTFLTHDNIFSLRILQQGASVDLTSTGVSRVVVTAAGVQIDSAVDSTAFDYATDGADGIIHFDFTDLSGLDNGVYICTITIFDILHPNGQVWPDRFELTVNPQVVT